MLQMGYPTRIYYTEADKALMWDRWQKGESLNEIGRHFGRSHSSIQNILSQTGGIRPPDRKRSRRCLSLSEREEISRGVVIHVLPGQVPAQRVLREYEQVGLAALLLDEVDDLRQVDVVVTWRDVDLRQGNAQRGAGGADRFAVTRAALGVGAVACGQAVILTWHRDETTASK
jgi:hypothetical protein